MYKIPKMSDDNCIYLTQQTKSCSAENTYISVQKKFSPKTILFTIIIIMELSYSCQNTRQDLLKLTAVEFNTLGQVQWQQQQQLGLFQIRASRMVWSLWQVMIEKYIHSEAINKALCREHMSITH